MIAAVAFFSASMNGSAVSCMPLMDVWAGQPQPPAPAAGTNRLAQDLGYAKMRLQSSLDESRVTEMTMAKSVAAIAFSRESSNLYKSASRATQTIHNVSGEQYMRVLDRTKTLDRRRERGIVSHSEAQEVGILNWLREGPSRSVIIDMTFDDVSTWVRGEKIKETNKKSHSVIGQTRKSSYKGLEVATMMGLVQNVFLRRHRPGPVEHVGLSGGAELLPKANFSTLRDRLNKWSLLHSEGVGGKLVLFNKEDIKKELDAIEYRCLMWTKDALGTNTAVIETEIGNWSKARFV